MSSKVRIGENSKIWLVWLILHRTIKPTLFGHMRKSERRVWERRWYYTAGDLLDIGLFDREQRCDFYCTGMPGICLYWIFWGLAQESTTPKHRRLQRLALRDLDFHVYRLDSWGSLIEHDHPWQAFPPPRQSSLEAWAESRSESRLDTQRYRHNSHHWSPS
jgi:hypothetical protein